ncbi:MAG: class I SAM-dependent methyltransferase [Candidatus Paceibacterota bacterium]
MTDFKKNIKNHYIGSSGDKYHLIKRKLHDELIPWVSEVRAKKFERYIKDNDVILEYGAGAGWNLYKLKNKHKFAYDISSVNKDKYIKNNIKFIEVENEIPDDSFDVCICHHVLEHVPSPCDTISNIYKSLKKNGILILVVPFERDISTQININDINAHIFSWTPQTLSNLIMKCGFNINDVKVLRTGYDRYAAMLSHKLNMNELAYKIIRNTLQIIRPEKEIFIIAKK